MARLSSHLLLVGILVVLLLIGARLSDRHTVDVLVLRRWSDISMQVHRLPAAIIRWHDVKVGNMLLLRRSNTVRFTLFVLLLELLLLVLLGDQLTQLLVSQLDLVQLHLMSVRLSFHLLLFFPSCSNFSCACIYSGLNTESFLGEALLACIVKVHRSAICLRTFHPTCNFNVGKDLSNTDFKLLLLCSQLI